MSTYLVAFAVTNFESRSEGNVSFAKNLLLQRRRMFNLIGQRRKRRNILNDVLIVLVYLNGRHD